MPSAKETKPPLNKNEKADQVWEASSPHNSSRNESGPDGYDYRPPSSKRANKETLDIISKSVVDDAYTDEKYSNFLDRGLKKDFDKDASTTDPDEQAKRDEIGKIVSRLPYEKLSEVLAAVIRIEKKLPEGLPEGFKPSVLWEDRYDAPGMGRLNAIEFTVEVYGEATKGRLVQRSDIKKFDPALAIAIGSWFSAHKGEPIKAGFNVLTQEEFNNAKMPSEEEIAQAKRVVGQARRREIKHRKKSI